MSDETKKLIEDLKAIRLELFRSAANLDLAIEQIEISMHKENKNDFIRMVAKGMRDQREMTSVHHNWEHLNELEKETWAKLIESIK